MFPLDDIISMAVMGQNKLNIYFGKAIFQIKAHPRFNALKYMQLYFHIKNKKKELPMEIWQGFWEFSIGIDQMMLQLGIMIVAF